MNNLISKYNLELSSVKSVEWKTQSSDNNSILFYNLNSNNDKALNLFNKRIKDCKYRYCIINSKESFDKNIIAVDRSEWSQLQKEVCDIIYPVSLESKKIIGITGTNGKTTTTDIIRQILVAESINVLTIGTLGVWKNDENISEFGLTTPSYIDFRKIIYQNKEIENIVCEVSSHALEQNRMFGVELDAAAWTSFSQDHLDYHESMDQYFTAKEKIVSYLKVEAKLFVSELDKEIIQKIKTAKLQVVSSTIDIENEYFRVKYNLKNLSLAVSILESLGFEIKESFEKLRPTPGRYNIIENGNGKVIIDFAHTPDAIENISKELKETYPRKKLIIVFGCGGDRDRTKRPLMASAASKFADYIIVTSDNPRFEDPSIIIKDTIKGITIKNYEMIEDRSLAIEKALKLYSGEIILIAGKGHENYIDQNGIKKEYSDEAEVLKRIKE